MEEAGHATGTGKTPAKVTKRLSKSFEEGISAALETKLRISQGGDG
jgi:hypothetical protein